MQIDPISLQIPGETGAKNASHALSLMTKKEVVVSFSKVTQLPLRSVIELVKKQMEQTVIVYTQVLTGVPGAAILTLERNSALNLVDMLIGKPLGESKILQEMDRSAIKETLNILSNNYVTAIAKSIGVTMDVNVPNMVTPEHLAQALDFIATEQGDESNILVFETTLTIQDVESTINLFIVFSMGLANLVKKNS